MMLFALAPHVEFTKPLHDVEVMEKETAKFECEVSRENAKVLCFFTFSSLRTDLPDLYILLNIYIQFKMHLPVNVSN